MNFRKTILLAADQQQSVLNALDSNERRPIAYTPYGHRPLENGLLSLLGFNGELPDLLTGHYHLGNGYRQFNPILMRFNSPDSWSPFGVGGLNAYAYCVGDPVNLGDPTGHTSAILKFFFRKLGFMDHPSIKFTEQQLIQAQKNTFSNIHTVHAIGKTPKEPYVAQVKLERHRQHDAARLSTNPEFTRGRTPTSTKHVTGEVVPSREHYSFLVLDHQSRNPASPPLERSSKVKFPHNPASVTCFDTPVPTPAGGWKKVEEIRMPKRNTLWSRRNQVANTQ